MIASHGGHENYRGAIYRECSKYIEVKSCGKYLNNTDMMKSDRYGETWRRGKLEFLKDNRFWFNICPENITEKGYITEKLYDALEGGSIPIYNARVDEDILKKEAYINFFEGNLEEKIKNKEKYYIENPFTEDAEEIIYNMYKNLGEKINSLLNS